MSKVQIITERMSQEFASWNRGNYFNIPD